jgi:uncharacterized protein
MRLIPGRDGWWCLAPSGTALIPNRFILDGELNGQGREAVERLGILEPTTPTCYSLTALTSTSCNLGCPYCFQNTGPASPGRFNPPRIKRAVVTSTVIDAIVEFTRARMADIGVSRLNVLLFGGEPLVNPLGCREILDRCADLGAVTGTMVSNGVLLRERLAVQLRSAGLRSVQISLSGPREIHDSVRTTRRGGATFDTILANVAAAQQATDLRFTFRVNLTPAALADIQPLIDQLAQVVDAARCGFAMTPVMDYGWGFNDLVTPSRMSSSTIVAAYALAQGYGFQIARPRYSYCGFCSDQRGRYGAVINADGTLFSCWESVGRPGYEVGTVAGGYTDYTPDQWVTCGRFADSTDTPHATTSFQDDIDAKVLDLIRDARLGPPDLPPERG